MNHSVIGWTSAYLSDYPITPFAEERKKALVERIRKRKYNFTYESHQNLPYAAPLYEDRTVCILTKPQWDSVMDEAYGDLPRGARLTPMDAIDDKPVNEILFEKNKFKEQFMGGEANG